jgi:hypothetical protein
MITDLDWFSSVLDLIATFPEIESDTHKKHIKQLSKCFAEKLPIWPREALKQKLKSSISEQKVSLQQKIIFKMLKSYLIYFI